MDLSSSASWLHWSRNPSSSSLMGLHSRLNAVMFFSAFLTAKLGSFHSPMKMLVPKNEAMSVMSGNKMNSGGVFPVKVSFNSKLRTVGAFPVTVSFNSNSCQVQVASLSLL